MDLLTIGMISLTALLALGIAGYAAAMHFRNVAAQRKIAVISAAIGEYFRKSDIRVTVSGMLVPGTDRFVVFIESEPMKQMRLSHMIETSLRDLLHNLHHIELDKVYWRFPLKSQPDGAAAPGPGQKRLDEYVTEGLSYRHLPKAEVQESSLEDFQQISTGKPKLPG